MKYFIATVVLVVSLLITGCVSLRSVNEIGALGREWGDTTTEYFDIAEGLMEAGYRLRKTSDLYEELDKCKLNGMNVSIACPSFFQSSGYQHPVALMRKLVGVTAFYAELLSGLASNDPLDEIKKRAKKFDKSATRADDAWAKYHGDGFVSKKKEIGAVDTVIFALSGLYFSYQRDRVLREIIELYHPTLIKGLDQLYVDIEAMDDIFRANRQSFLDKANKYAINGWGDSSLPLEQVVHYRMSLMKEYYSAMKLYERSEQEYVCPGKDRNCPNSNKVNAVLKRTRLLKDAMVALHQAATRGEELDIELE